MWRAEYYGTLLNGGVATYFNEISKAFQKNGIETLIVSSGEVDKSNYNKTINIRYSKLFSNLPEVLNLYYNFKVIKKIKSIIKTHKPDFIYLQHHDFQLYTYLLNSRIPFFLHVDGFQGWVKKNWGKLYLSKIHNIIEKLELNFADHLFVPSSILKSFLLEQNLNNNIEVVPNGVDPDFFTPDKDGTYIREKFGLQDNFVCGFAGTFGNWHGVDTIAESINQIVEQIPNAKVFLIGDGPLRPDIERIIDASNSRDNVIITGMIEFAEMPNYMAACDVLLTPCKNNDDNSAFFNSPLKLYEYMAMEKPIVASFIGQQAEVIEDKVNGVAINANDVSDLVRGIKFVYDNPEIAKSMSKQARKDAIEKYSWEIHVKKIIKIYEDIMAKKLNSKKSQ